MLSNAVRGSLEPVLNLALAADPKAQERLRAVNGKIVRITLHELPESLTLAFHEREVSLLGPNYEGVDAAVTLSLFDLAELTDAATATHAIQHGKVALVGDPMLLQRAAAVFMELDIDWQELLASWFGDVPGYVMSEQLARLFKRIEQRKITKARVQEVLIEELAVLASPVQCRMLKEQIAVEQRRLDALEQKLTTLGKAE
ncbi:ubiquinone biosynthesis accessory factor UbiJ [Aliidiomarina celeris]|uniref:ubiquinone biosynthesis accessory factor UbiJ n=1 Tax=Aliidiomarina celeris TaxID=2249428 RepID=UPI000DE9371A|nr:SCP2 sterol-binding domain-containing protein [Aliidiomarina celeris]